MAWPFLKSRRLWIALVLLTLALLLWMLARPKPIDVQTVEVRSGDIVVEVSDSGLTRFRSVTTILSPQSGWLSEIMIRSGQVVQKNKTLLAEIRAAQAPLMDAKTRATLQAQLQAAVAQQTQALAQIQRLKKQLKAGEEQLSRMQRVLATGGVSVQELENLKTRNAEIASEIQMARAQADSLQHAVEAARATLQPVVDTRIRAEAVAVRSPQDGILSWIYDEKPRFVSVGAPLFDVAQIGSLTFEMDLLAEDSLQVRHGQRVRFSQHEITGAVRAVSPTAQGKISPLGVSEQRVRVWIDFDVPTPAHWPSGLELEAQIETQRKNGVLLVPSTAIWREGDDFFVFLIEKKKLQKQRVRIGLQSANATEVSEGLSAGDHIAQYPNEEMKEGQAISARI